MLFLQIDLDKRLGCIWHVIVGEEYGFEISYEASMTYVHYGSLAILMWKCGTQLMSEIKYKPINEEEEDVRVRAKKGKGGRRF